MMKGILLLAAMLGMTVLGTYSATGREPAPTETTAPSDEPVDFGGCKYYCGAHGYTTIGQCSAACGGAGNCDKVC